ncbi:NlpC/P60 family protein [Hahella ganghwensis]|uniref:NlpC/P60 family protein n=1 Tax=Hahella ganghwensis TaxID=286420 RepID=UPI000376BEAB|nr:NlpC/P60 family protein [Hahella ganghwensis]
MNLTYSVFLILLFSAVLAGCSSTPVNGPHNSLPSVTTPDQHNISTLLLNHYEGWRGTPYKMGGLNKRGIDCSGFVFRTYQELFRITLPRSTSGQVHAGNEIPLTQAAPGDLLIFKTGLKQRHVGIYVGKGRFIHSSTSRGVIISSLNTPYWEDAYRESRRVL